MAVHAAVSLLPASWRRASSAVGSELRWTCYALAGGISAALVGPWLVLVLLGCGVVEVAAQSDRRASLFAGLLGPATVPATGGVLALAWVAIKVGALSYGGGFVIIPLMQHDAVETYHWMTAAQFLNAVALGQVTPGPVVQTVAVVGYAAAGIGGGLLAAAIVFAPSFVFVLGGGPYFRRIIGDSRVQGFFGGAGPAALGAIAGAAVPLALALDHNGNWASSPAPRFGCFCFVAAW